MKILLVNHGRAGEFGGGDSVQIRETGKGLQQRGHEVAMVNSDVPDVRGFDLVHLFNCRVQDSFSLQVAECRKLGVPIILSPIWMSIGRALWGSRGTLAILQQVMQQGEASAKPLFSQLKHRTLAVGLGDDRTVQPHGVMEHCQGGMSLVADLLHQVNGLLPNSWLELQALRSDLQWCGPHFDVAHYGVDPRVFLDSDPELFRRHTGIQGSFVLQAGRIEPAKNQAMLCWALRETKLPIVFIGGSDNWPGYATLCREISGDRLKIIDHLPQHLLASAYAAADVHVLPSWMETCGLVTLEASLSGTPVVGSTFGHELEYLRGDAWYCDPADPDSIREAVLASLKAGRNNQRSLKLKRRVLEEFNWEQTVDSTEKFYLRVLSEISSSH